MNQENLAWKCNLLTKFPQKILSNKSHAFDTYYTGCALNASGKIDDSNVVQWPCEYIVVMVVR